MVTRLWPHGADRDAPHRDQVLDVEMQPHAEHQQDDADLGELAGELGIGDEAGRVRADQDPCQQIPHDGGPAEPVREVSEGECADQAAARVRSRSRLCIVRSVRGGPLVGSPEGGQDDGCAGEDLEGEDQVLGESEFARRVVSESSIVVGSLVHEISLKQTCFSTNERK